MRIPPPAVIDCHFFIHAVTLTSAERRSGARPPEFDLIRAFELGHFLWAWEPEILDEYANVVEALIAKHRPGQPTIDKGRAKATIADIRRAGVLAGVTEDTYQAAWDAVMDEGRSPEERDEDDVIYLAAADAAGAIALLSSDRSLKNLAPPHHGARVVSSLAQFLGLVGFKSMGKASTR